MGHLKLFLQSGNPKALFAAFLYFDMSFMVWVLLGALGNFIAADLGLSDTQKGLMTALPILSGALLRVPMGIAADSWSCRKMGLLGLALTTVPLLVGWTFADRLESVYLVGILLGVAGASFAVALPLASRWYPPEQQGLALGIAGAGNSGTVFASLFAPRIAEHFGWQAVFGLALIPILLAFVVFFLFAHDAPNRTAKTRLRDYATALRHGDAVRFCLFYSVTFGGFVGLASYLAIFLRDEYGLSRVAAGDIVAVCVFAGSFARPIGGFLADRFGGIRVLLVLLVMISASLATLSSLLPIEFSAVLFFLTMAFLGAGNGAVFQLVPQRFPREIGVITGLVGFAGGIGGFLMPFLLGFLRDETGTYTTGFLLFAACALLVSGVLFAAQIHWRATWAPRGSMALHGRVQATES